jgi:hypothetical protein
VPLAMSLFIRLDTDNTGYMLLQIDAQMSTDINKIMALSTEKDESPQTEDTRTVRAVKGDLMMERDLIKHMKMVRAQIVNGENVTNFKIQVFVYLSVHQVGEPMGTKDVESQIKFLKEDLDFLLLNPEAAGYAKIPYDSRKRRLELAQRIKSLVDYLQYRLVTEHGCR